MFAILHRDNSNSYNNNKIVPIFFGIIFFIHFICKHIYLWEVTQRSKHEQIWLCDNIVLLLFLVWTVNIAFNLIFCFSWNIFLWIMKHKKNIAWQFCRTSKRFRPIYEIKWDFKKNIKWQVKLTTCQTYIHYLNVYKIYFLYIVLDIGIPRSRSYVRFCVWRGLQKKSQTTPKAISNHTPK